MGAQKCAPSGTSYTVCACAGDCGDGTMGVGEECDDGNLSDFDFCLNTCVAARCGDGVRGPGEACDDGNEDDDDECTTACRAPTCGNGVIDGLEQCDDANSDETDGCLSTCISSRCGDGNLGPGEECDDGNSVDDDACSNACVLPYCGDGVVNGGEGCDDGNRVDDDECSNACAIASCGNGKVESNEACDDGNDDDTDTCLSTCVAARCGDGVKASNEECDDGNTQSGDGCSVQCKTSVCGNGVVEDAEECDDGNTTQTDGCLNTCVAARCGDGIVGPGEECDDGNTNNDDACGNGCLPVSCGDKIVQAGEECDDGNTVNDDSCSNNCKLAVCGDGILHAGEECDDGNTNDTDACVACKNAICGDSHVQTSKEQCDDGNADDTDACVTCQLAKCGDGHVRAGEEECDDGNTDPGDGCEPDCTESLAVCGNGEVEFDEECDDANFDNTDGCTETCHFPTCGDGFVQPANGEDCDDENDVDGDGCNTDCITSGKILWHKTYNGPDNGHDDGRGIAINLDGDVIVVGASEVTGKAQEMFLWRLPPDGSSDGTSRTLDGVGAHNDILNDVAITSTNQLAVVGTYYTESTPNPGNRPYYGIFNSTLNLDWSDIGPDSGIGNGVVVDGSDNVYITGSIAGTSTDVWVRRFGLDQQVAWSGSFDYGKNSSCDNPSETGYALALSADGSFAYPVGSYGCGTVSGCLWRFNTTTGEYVANSDGCTRMWRQRDVSQSTASRGVVVAPEGDVFVAGSISSGGHLWHYRSTLCHLSSCHSPNCASSDWDVSVSTTGAIQAMARAPDGTLVVGGATSSNTGGVRKLDPSNGGPMWGTSSTFTGDDDLTHTAGIYGVAVDPAGYVYVTGSTAAATGGNRDIWVAKLAP